MIFAFDMTAMRWLEFYYKWILSKWRHRQIDDFYCAERKLHKFSLRETILVNINSSHSIRYTIFFWMVGFSQRGEREREGVGGKREEEEGEGKLQNGFHSNHPKSGYFSDWKYPRVYVHNAPVALTSAKCSYFIVGLIQFHIFSINIQAKCYLSSIWFNYFVCAWCRRKLVYATQCTHHIYSDTFVHFQIYAIELGMAHAVLSQSNKKEVASDG